MTGLDASRPRPRFVAPHLPPFDLALARRLSFLMLPMTVALGYLIGSSSPDRLLILALAGLWVLVLVVRKVVLYVFVANVTLLVLLPHIFANANLQQWWLLAIGGQCLLALVAARSFPLHREDLGFVLLLLATAWPYAVGGSIGTLPGAIAGPVVMYATGRLSRQPMRTIVIMLLVLSTVQALIAIAEWQPSISSYIPFVPVRNGLEYNTSRAVGFFNNPNTLGTVLMAAMLLTALVEPRRWVLPFVAICAAALLLSGSRESVLGLLVGIGMVSLGHFGRVSRLGIVVALGLLMAAQAFPNVLDRFDVAGYANDPSFVARLSQWTNAVEYIGHSSAMGYGASLPVDVVDDAYLGWLLSGGFIGLAIWVVGLVLVTPRMLWPLLVAFGCVAVLANPFSGPSLAVLLIACGAATTDRDLRRSARAGKPAADQLGHADRSVAAPAVAPVTTAATGT